ncbi:hypothetical protein DFO73_11595 [Cytobacillus oceanisediminis]|uniref:Uncharacterized protein n=1 Tax=Cytobacillus oceanisediminis TaxID=665099 RepID=A0A2V2ZNJ9_9BACI|nr:hypothetical protein DFO73_11595 [Cytobacillus oceanisediminis]
MPEKTLYLFIVAQAKMQAVPSKLPLFSLRFNAASAKRKKGAEFAPLTIIPENCLFPVLSAKIAAFFV